jgi:hypothetical protein
MILRLLLRGGKSRDEESVDEGRETLGVPSLLMKSMKKRGPWGTLSMQVLYANGTVKNPVNICL